MISSTLPSKLKKISIKILKAVFVTAFWILVWEAVSRFVARDNELMYLLLPRPETVFKKWLEIAFTGQYLSAVFKTIQRIISGFLIGLVCGLSAGVWTHLLKVADWILSPLFKIIRAVPVVAITILFFSLFKSEYLPVCIVALMVTPLIWQTVHDGLSAPETELSEMARVFRLGTVKTLVYIKLPSLLPSLLTATVNALGLAWKSGIAAEVICEPDVALGTVLMQGKGMIDFSSVYAVTLTVVILSLIIEVLLKFLCRRFVGRREAVR